MAKVADIKLMWSKSPSSDIDRVNIVVTNNGTETTTELGPEVEDFAIVVQASGAASFKIVTFDTEGKQATSELYSFTLGDLEDPLPATNLTHEVMGIRDDNPQPPNTGNFSKPRPK